MPLDLHVLSLQLAFILSQDQTLHCKSIVNRSEDRLLLCSGRSNLKKLFNYLYIISIDGSFFYPGTYLKKSRMYLLLYYLYCLCKSVQRSLVLRLLFFSKADAKVRTLFHIFQIFSEVFFIFFLSSSHLSCERKNKEKELSLPPGFQKDCQTTLLSF